MNIKHLLAVALVLTVLGIIAKIILLQMPQPVRYDDLGSNVVNELEKTK